MPSEDELAQCTMTGLSPYMGLVLPRGRAPSYDRYLTFRDVPGDEVARWKRADHFFKKLTLQTTVARWSSSRPRTPLASGCSWTFPRRPLRAYSPRSVRRLCSTRHLIRAVQPIYRLQEGPTPDGDDRIISVYTEMYDAFFEERSLIAEGRLCEVAYEDLEREPVAWSGRSTRSLGLSGFEDFKPRLEGYLERSPVIARTGTKNFPKRFAVGSPRIGAGFRRVGIRALTPGICPEADIPSRYSHGPVLSGPVRRNDRAGSRFTAPRFRQRPGPGNEASVVIEELQLDHDACQHRPTS